MLLELIWLLKTRTSNSNVKSFLYPKANQVRPQTTFGQEMPLLLNSSGISGNGNETSRSQSTGPPILPPHLLQVILNKVRGALTQKR